MLPIRALLRTIIPRVVRARRDQPPVSTQTPTDLVHTPAEWWKQAQYTKVPRPKRMEWLGLKLPLGNHFETIKGSYFWPAHDLVNAIVELQTANVVLPLCGDSKVFEPGCNVGRNLYHLRKNFGCEIFGMDISDEAIRIAKNDIWKGIDRTTFMVDNVLTTPYFEGVPDDWFDLCYTRWHLVHIPKSREKTKYIEHLKRISKALILFEPTRKERQGTTEFYHGGEYALSFDNWAEDYGLERFDLEAPLEDNTQVFHWKKSLD